MAGGDAGSAIADNLIRGHVADRCRDRRAQFFRRAEEPLLVEVPLEEMILRAGDVAADLVDWFAVAAVALGRAGVDQARSGGTEARGDRRDVHGHVRARRPGERARRPAGLAALDRPPFGRPRLEPAVEHRHRVVSQPAQQPPQAAGEHAVFLVVGHDLHAAGDPQPAERLRQRLRIGQGVASVRPIFGTGEVMRQVGVDRAGDVGGRVLAAAPGKVVELGAAVDDRVRRIVHV